MAGVRKLPSGKWQGWFKDAKAKRTFFTLPGEDGKRKAVVQRHAAALELEHERVQRGVIVGPEHPSHQLGRPLAEVVDEYLIWGKLQGGIGGRAWNTTHAHNRAQQLAWWQEQLRVQTLGGCQQILGQVDQALQGLTPGHSGKTVAGYRESLAAFFDWCVRRDYLPQSPLRRSRPLDTTPETRRRAMTLDEIHALLAASPGYRALLYEVAVMTGLRAGELRQLTRQHLDTARGGLLLDASWTKNRKAGFQPLPEGLLSRLLTFTMAETAQRLYQRTSRRRKRQPPPQALLYVPTLPARMFLTDLHAANIPRETAHGVLDFHALRTTYINLVIAAGATVPEAQALARHATPAMTFGVYGRADQSRLVGLVDQVAENLLSRQKRAPDVHRLAVGETTSTPHMEVQHGSLRGLQPDTQPEASRNLAVVSPNPPEISSHVSTHIDQIFDEHRKESVVHPSDLCVPGVHDGLQELVDAWAHLSAETKSHIAALLRGHVKED